MNKPHITCYMMTSVDGRIDCAMTTELPGEEYYPILDDLNFDATIMGRVTAEFEFAEQGRFNPSKNIAVNKELFSNKIQSKKCIDVIVDTNGVLLWKDASEYELPICIVTSEKVSTEYLEYLDSKNISYIVSGKNEIDLVRATEILKEQFNVNRLGIVGGPSINTAFLDAKLLDEVIVLIGAGIDGRSSYPPLFNRTKNQEQNVTPLKLIDVKSYESGAVLIKYSVLNK